MRVWGSFYAQNLRYHLEIFSCVLNDISSLAHRNSPKFTQIIHLIAIQLSGKFKENLPFKTIDFRPFHMVQFCRKSLCHKYVVYHYSHAPCMQDTFARATHSAKRARDDRVSCIQARARRSIQLISKKYVVSKLGF